MRRAATPRISRNLLTVNLIIAWTATSALGVPQDECIPTFGTTVVIPGGLVGIIYPISPLSRYLPNFQWLDPIGVIYTSSLDVTPRNFLEGFPGVTDRFEWFAIDYSGRFWIENSGVYRFELTSDDGSKLYIDDSLVVNNDGIHPPETKTGELMLAGGIHRIRVSYFQGPRDDVALVLRVAGPGEDWRIFSTEEFKPPTDPATWMSFRRMLHISSITSKPGENLNLEISLDSAATRAPIAFEMGGDLPGAIDGHGRQRSRNRQRS